MFASLIIHVKLVLELQITLPGTAHLHHMHACGCSENRPLDPKRGVDTKMLLQTMATQPVQSKERSRAQSLYRTLQLTNVRKFDSDPECRLLFALRDGKSLRTNVWSLVLSVT